MEKTIEIPEGYEARVEGNKVIFEPKESEDERTRKELLYYIKYDKEHTPETTPGEHWDRWIAYLERQQKPALDNYLKAAPAERRKMSMTEILEKEQNPTEWSEREKRLMKALQITNARIAELVEENYNLKEQKQEWSEEDENRFNNLCRIIDDSNWNEASKQGFKNFLKSLRPQPHWKPSEEQMIALRQVISGCSYDIEPLVEIEEHLKKLREE